ncbi:uncharacterized protein LOC119686400 [Teleopsis dalmanni]|uniref:uncharacterized protein LOC119686400 n=1 Tax=Teleopsis dalmanni TaxID=139649 RepID=UPI0018CEB7E2|nr:uncharacterized protein LOC119686400 [Teleopsis dalmanni]XP_037956905.1 uncharacterized protein LOC119686400 [Teleopsis dalmanni]XP_037956906.1 uncharacterized protein LOC119686400 [Teleopsis dalmanni]
MGNRPSCTRKQNNTNTEKNLDSSVNKSPSNTKHNSETEKELSKTQPVPKSSKSQELNKTDSKSSNSSKIKPKTSKTTTSQHKPQQQKKKPTTETDYDDEEFSLSKLRARNQAAAQNNPPAHPTHLKPGISYADAARSANEIKICSLNPQQPSGSAHTQETDYENEEFSLARLYANKNTKPPSNQKINETKQTTQQKKLNPEPSKVTPGISYADALRTSDINQLKQEKAQLKSVSSFCLLCQKQKPPLVKDHLDARIKQLIGNHPAKTVTLTLTLQTNGIFHINISLSEAGNYIGCLLATENAISTLSRTSDFKEYFKIFIANDENTVKKKEHLVHPAITLTRHKE